MLIVFLFLHSWRSTVITGLTLPIAVIATFIALYAFGFTLNFMTLMALSLCIGLLIDDAIVVRENIVRHLALGKDHVTAAREGTDEIGLAVMATTFAIVAVFVPIAFMSGIIGRFFLQFGLTVTVAVLVSLFVSFTLDPMLSSVWHDPPGERFSRVPWLGRLMERVEQGIDWIHARVRTRARVGAGASHQGPRDRAGQLRRQLPGACRWLARSSCRKPTRVSFRCGSTRPWARAWSTPTPRCAQVEAALKSFPEIALVMTTVGTSDGRNYARVNLRLTERSERERSQKQIERAIRSALKPVPGIELAIGFNRPVWVNLLGPDPERLTALISQFALEVAKIPGIADLEISEKAAQSGAVDSPQQRRRRRPGHQRPAGRRHGAAAARRRHGELLAGAGRTEL